VAEKMSNQIAERVVLSGIAQFGYDVFADVDDIVNQSVAFTDEVHQALYKCFQHIYKENDDIKPDIPTIYSAAKQLGFSDILSTSQERSYVKSLFNYGIEKSNVKSFAAQTRKLFIARQLYQQHSKSQYNLETVTGTEPISKILGLSEDPIFDFTDALNSTQNDGPVRLSCGLKEYLDYVEAHPCDIVGISTGYPRFDAVIGGGLQRQSVSLICARLKKGKSFIVDNVAVHVSSKLSIPTLVLDSEMNIKMHWNRVLAMLSGVSINLIKTGKYSTDQKIKQKVRDAEKIIGEMPYEYHTINGKPFEDIVSTMRRWVTKTVGYDSNGVTNPCIIAYDYLKIMDASELKGDLREYQLLGLYATGIHNFGFKYNLPILLATQVNRDGIEKQNTGVISASDRIGWLVHNGSLWKEKTDDEIIQDGRKNGNFKLINLFTRDGEGMEDDDYISMQFDKSIGRITEIGTMKELTKLKNQQDFHGVDDDDHKF
jgi:replicative DNA helicase